MPDSRAGAAAAAAATAAAAAATAARAGAARAGTARAGTARTGARAGTATDTNTDQGGPSAGTARPPTSFPMPPPAPPPTVGAPPPNVTPGPPSSLPSGPGEFCDFGLYCDTSAGLYCRVGFGSERPTCRYFVSPCSACKRRDAVCWDYFYCDDASGRCTGWQCGT